MRQPNLWARAVLSGALITLCGVACDTVLDIQDPKMRPDAAGGEGGDRMELNGAGTNGAGTNGAGTNGAGANGAGAMPGGGANGNVTMPGGGDGGAEPITVMAGAGGETGKPTMKDCEPDALRCGSDAAAKTPQICDATGHWVANTEEAAGDCAVLCDAGQCVECVATDSPRCAVCEDGEASCSTNQPQTCVNGVWVDASEAPCPQLCYAGLCRTAPSCDAFNTERTTCQGDKSCCTSILVPGGDFTLVDNFSDQSVDARIGQFYLDKFEVTVGRMRQFVLAFESFKSTLKDGQGTSMHLMGDLGWNSTYPLPADRDALVASLKCSGTTWSDMPTINNDLPVNCVSFYTAYAFCIWDRGRLPTEAEWSFAAIGGDEARLYPWPAPPMGAGITNDYANYGNDNPGPIPVGSKSPGDGRWRQSDLAGNVGEWVLDYHGDYPQPCNNCVNTIPAQDRVNRGGAYIAPADFLSGSYRTYDEPDQAHPWLGFRCARDLN